MKSITTIPGITDHEAIIADSDIKTPYVKKKSRKVHVYKKAKWDAIHETVAFAEQFIEVLDQLTIEENWQKIKNHLAKMMNDHIPSKFTTTRFNLPWITDLIKWLNRKKKQRLYNKAKKSHKQ